MASSSLSQESLEHEVNIMARKNKVKIASRNRAVYTKHGSIETTDDHEMSDMKKMEEMMGGMGGVMVGGILSPGNLLFDHESPNRVNKMKEKRWPMHKKQPMVKDKRKLREKRRSSGVVHVASTESSDDSIDESDANNTNANNITSTTTTTSTINSPLTTTQTPITPSTIQSTITTSLTDCGATPIPPLSQAHHNEVIDADNPQTPEEDRKPFTNRAVRNKSPSDLDADLEDNQDYDSTFSHSDATSRPQSCSSARLPSHVGGEDVVVGSGVRSGVGSGRGMVGVRGMDCERGHDDRVVNKRVGFENLSRPNNNSISSPPIPKGFLSYGNVLRQQHHHHHHHHHHSHNNNKHCSNKNNDDVTEVTLMQQQQRSNNNNPAEESLRLEKLKNKELQRIIQHKDDLINTLQKQLFALNKKSPDKSTGI